MFFKFFIVLSLFTNCFSEYCSNYIEVFSRNNHLEFANNAIFNLKGKALVFKDLSKFPEVRRDLSLVVDKVVKFKEIRVFKLIPFFGNEKLNKPKAKNKIITNNKLCQGLCIL